MAGLDGIKNKTHPGEAMDKNLYDLPAEELADIPTVCGSLREAMKSCNQIMIIYWQVTCSQKIKSTAILS